MFDDRFYSETYDLYRPTLSVSASRVQTIVTPGTATESGQKCHFVPKPGRFTVEAQGLAIDYDARMLIPNSQSLRPSAKGEQPDHVVIGSQTFVVLMCWQASGQSYCKVVLLQEKTA